MSDTKIVIDKEDWDKIASEFNSNELPPYTEIQIDQSIEERATEFLDENCILDRINGMYSLVEPKDLINFATQQQIIEQLKVKEKEYFEFEHHCGNKVTKKEVFFDHCIKCGEYFEDIEP